MNGSELKVIRINETTAVLISPIPRGPREQFTPKLTNRTAILLK